MTTPAKMSTFAVVVVVNQKPVLLLVSCWTAFPDVGTNAAGNGIGQFAGRSGGGTMLRVGRLVSCACCVNVCAPLPPASATEPKRNTAAAAPASDRILNIALFLSRPRCGLYPRSR